MTASLSETPPSKREQDELLERHGFRRGQLFAGKYRLEGLLGEGGMGIVLLATHVDLHRTVAIKVVRSELARNDEIVERLLAEAQAAANIRSEHVTRVLDLGRLDSGTPYIVLEFLDGRDLAALLDEHGPLPTETAVDFVLQVCDALAEAHAAGIIHRDLKPENLFLTYRPDGTPIVKLIDFGISKNLMARDRRAALTNPAQLVGSPYYMAPEQMRGVRGVDARADLWALGVVLYELLTGQTPFAADSIPAVCHLVMNEHPTPPRTFAPELPPELEAVILCCLEKEPNERFGDVADFANALAPFATQEGLIYADRVQRVMAAASSRERSRAAAVSGKFVREPSASQPEVRAFSESARNLPTQQSLEPMSLRTPAALSTTRRSSPYSSFKRDVRRSRRRGLRWTIAAAAIVVGGAALTLIARTPIPAPPPGVAVDRATPTTFLPPAPVATALPAADPPPPPSAAPSGDGELGPLERVSSSRTSTVSAPHRFEGSSFGARSSLQSSPATSTAELATSASAAPPAPSPPATAVVAPEPSAPPAVKARRAVDPWDRKSFGGRR